MQVTNLIGILLPPLIDLINSKVESSAIRFWVSFLICAALGTASHVATNMGITGVDPLVGDILSVFGLSQVSYKALYEGGTMQKGIRTFDRGNTPQRVTEEVTEHIIPNPSTTNTTFTIATEDIPPQP